MVQDPPASLSQPPAAAAAEPHTGFDTLPASSAALFGAAGDPFSTIAWYRHLASSVLSEHGALRIETAHTGASTLVMPLFVQRANRRVLRSAANFYTSLYAPPHSGDPAPAALAWARKAKAARWAKVELAPMDADAPLYGALADGLRQAGFITQRYFCFGNWYLPVAGRSYDAYAAALPSRLRHTLARKSRQLAAMPGFRIEILRSIDDVPRAVQAIHRVYGASWKDPEPYPSFMPGLVRLLAERGALRMGVAYLGNAPAAFQLWIVEGGVASIYKLAYDEAHARLSIGSVLTAALMRHAIDIDQVREVDYLTGDEPYKQDWMSHRRERWGLAAFNPATLQGLYGAVRHVLGRRLKRLLRS
ncbi:MAG TPA: GNAT family N-acetyltransferase [Burkholderiaceae bacterium]